ncbi:uncharacterized protein LOC116306945 [Actinia tenebrosa]|uniref:Uncharacterized protein LOC116306945 n=1 Tax=Actinia tenebrosa TaxID=6105 RepID=A0A6P8IZI0_ACTTE|nr:uncharacterized protein LOC116306945 [Actinia tenebrosa]
MAGIHKIILALVVLHVALVLHIEGSLDKRATDCGSGREHEGSYSRKCRSSCKHGERHISMFDKKCSGGQKCCMCHTRWSTGCRYEG